MGDDNPRAGLAETVQRFLRELAAEGGTNYLGPATCRAISDLRAESTALRAQEPASDDGLCGRFFAELEKRHMLYTGTYREALVEALNIATAALRAQEPASDDGLVERVGTEQHLCGHCGAHYLLMGAGYIDAISEALDRAGAPKWSDDRSIMFSLIERIAALKRAEPASADGLCERLEQHRFKGNESDLRMRFNKAVAGGPNMNGDSGPIIYTEGHAHDLEDAIETIRTLTRELATARAQVEELANKPTGES